MSQVVSEAVMQVASGQSESMRIGGYRQLFVDDHVVERRINCRREFNQVEKASFNPIIVCDKPWERGEGWYIERMTLIDDPHYGLLRAWYETIKTYKDRPSETYMCYATSQDGVHWHKPNLGIVEFDGSKDNNIVAHPKSEASSMRWFDLDPREKDPSHRYKSLDRGPNGQFIPKYSADGFRAATAPDKLTRMTFYDDCTPPVWDPQADCWVFYRRSWSGGIHGKGTRQKGIALSEDPTLEKWFPKNHLIIEADELDAEEAARRGADLGEFYAMMGFPYQGMWFGGVELLWRTVGHRDENGTMIDNDDGPQDMQLAWSRDLLHWQRPNPRQQFIPLGASSDWDAGMIYGIARPLIKDDEIWFYYNGFRCDHFCDSLYGNNTFDRMKSDPRWTGTPWLHDHEWNSSSAAIGLAKLRLDGFAHLETGYVAGLMTTKPIMMTGRAIGINAAVDGGMTVVEIQDEAGQRLEGFSIDDCDPFTGDSLRHEVTWRGSADLSSLRGRTVRLHFRMRQTRLYAFWLVDGGESSPSPRQRVRAAVEALPPDLVDRLGEMDVPERIDVRQLLISYRGHGIPATRTKEEALRLANQLLAKIKQAPEKFDEIAREHNETAWDEHHERSMWGPMVRGQVSPEFEWVAFQLNVGEITPEPVDTPAGFQIIKRVG